MYRAIKNYCDDQNITNGLFLIDMPTGFGKTHNVLDYIFETAMDDSRSQQKLFFITTLKKNLPKDDLRKRFEKAGDIARFREKFLFIDSNADCVIERLTKELIRSIPDSIKKTDEYKALERDVKFIQNSGVDTKPELRPIVARVKDDLRQKSEPQFRNYVSSLICNQLPTVQTRLQAIRTSKEWQWLGELYPAVFTRDRQIIFMSIDKFLARNSTIVEPSYMFYNSDIINDAIIFIDEFDATKETLLKNIIQNGLRDRIDYLELFRDIYAALQTKSFPTILTTPSQRRLDSDYKGKTLQSIIDGFQERAESIHKDYCLQFSHKTSSDGSDSSRNFMFQDHRYHSILDGNKNFVTTRCDDTAHINWIDFVEDKPAQDHNNIFVMLGQLRGFVTFFQRGISILALNYRELKREQRRPNEDEFTQEAAVRSVLAEFRLERKHIDYLTSEILMASRRRSNTLESPNYDLSFYEKGFRYYAFKNDMAHDLQSQIMVCTFQTTPEKILLRFCDKAMMTHSPGNLNVLKTVLQQDKDADKITISQLNGEDLYSDVITQLLLNGMASAKSRFLRFNNLTGQLYCFHPQWLKHSKNNGQDVITKVPCLRVNVTRQLRMEATVCTFTSVLLRNKITFRRRRFEEYPQYVLSVHNTLRRKLEQDAATGYIQRQTDNDRSDIPFIDFQSIARFEQSKMGVIWQVVSDFNAKYDGLARLSFEETASYTALDYDRSTSKEDKQAVRTALSEASVRLVDTIRDEYSSVFCKNISELFSDRYGISVPISKKVTKGHLNVRVIHNKDYYEGGHDPHDDEFADAAVQHITLEDFADNCETAISTIVHELLIKQDLQNGRISLFNWQALNYQHDWSFGIASEGEPRRYYFMTIHSDGSFSIREQTLNLFEQSEYDDCVTIFEDEKRSAEQVRGIVRDGNGKINVIRDTGWYTIPQIEQIQEELSVGNTYLRNKAARNELLSACLDIKYIPNDDCGYYFVGTIGNGMRANIARASNIRKIEGYCGAPIFFEQLLPLMNVSFVRNGQLTILPFPFKYLREYVAGNK